MSLEKWEIDSSHSGVHFSVRHLVIAKVRGQFARWSATVLAEGGDFARASVSVVIDAASIDTGLADRDKHLKSADFFDVARYPEITFKSTKVEQLSGDRLRATGDLTLHGVTREVALEIESAGRTQDPWGNQRAGFSAKLVIDRKDFGLTWNQVLDAGGVMVGEKVTVEIDAEAVQQVAAKAA